jgi:hypothetical protein
MPPFPSPPSLHPSLHPSLPPSPLLSPPLMPPAVPSRTEAGGERRVADIQARRDGRQALFLR